MARRKGGGDVCTPTLGERLLRLGQLLVSGIRGDPVKGWSSACNTLLSGVKLREEDVSLLKVRSHVMGVPGGGTKAYQLRKFFQARLQKKAGHLRNNISTHPPNRGAVI